MSVYRAFFRIHLMEALAYRVEALIWFLFDLLPPVVMVFLWLAVYEGQAMVAGFTLQQMLGYYIGILVLGTLLTSHIEWGISYEIRQGQLSRLLIRPASPWAYWFVDNLAWKLLRGAYLLPCMVLLVVALGDLARLPALTPLQVTTLLASIGMAFVLCFVLKGALGMLAFWINDVSGLITLWDVLLFLFGGTMLPLELLPTSLQRVAGFMPFRFIYAFPLGIALGRTDEASGLQGLAMQAAWLVAALLVARLLWRAGLRRYEAVGN